MLLGLTIKEAKKVLEDVGLTLKLNVEDETGIDKSVTKITDQIPKKGISIEQGTNIICEIK